MRTTPPSFRLLALILALLLSHTLFVPGVDASGRGGQEGGRPPAKPTPAKKVAPKSPISKPDPIRRYRCAPTSTNLSHAQQRRKGTPTAHAEEQKPEKKTIMPLTSIDIPQGSLKKKTIMPLTSVDTPQGSLITILADAPLNDYSAYRSGDRYYVVIPESSAPAGQSGMRGRGFEDLRVQKRGNDTVLSFKLQPGANARIDQSLDRLDVILTAPENPPSDNANRNPAPAITKPTPAIASGEANTTEPRSERAVSTPMRTVAGHKFRCQEGVWIDNTYDSSRQTINVRRSSEDFRNLIKEDPSINVIAQRFSGELIIMWKGRAYRIR